MNFINLFLQNIFHFRSIDGVPIKGLGTSRSGTPSRVSSPHGTASPKIGSPRQVRSERLSLSTNRPSDAINFFHYASLGHGVLLRTFKYLKVQVSYKY